MAGLLGPGATVGWSGGQGEAGWGVGWRARRAGWGQVGDGVAGQGGPGCGLAGLVDKGMG